MIVRYVITKFIPRGGELVVDYYLRGNQVGEIPYHVFGVGETVESDKDKTAGGKQSWMPELTTIVSNSMV